MAIPGLLGGENPIFAMLLNFLFLMVLLVFFPRIMIFQILYKLRKSVDSMEENAEETQKMFYDAVGDGSSMHDDQRMERMKNMVVSAPTGIDPAGLVKKLERTLDDAEIKMTGFVDDFATRDLDEEERADLSMAFKGVYGTQQIFVVIRHFKELIEKTKNPQIGAMIQMTLPLYEELADSQKKATEAFVNNVPIGDSVGPLIAAKFMENEPEEMAEDVIVSEEELGDKKLYVLKSKGPGARLGKYGDAIRDVVENNNVGKMYFVDAGMRFEGEETGKVVEGVGVMMGGPGVEKFKIEEVAKEHGIPMDGYVIKQSGPQASKPMHSDIYKAVPEAVATIKNDMEQTPEDRILLVGVGNTCGVGNSKQSTSGIPNKLKKYWAEEEEDPTSYFGLAKVFPMGGMYSVYGRLFGFDASDTAQQLMDPNNTFRLFQSLVR